MNTFTIPDLQRYFLRGADVGGVPNGDPDWDKRISYEDMSPVIGAGSTQKVAVALPRILVSNDVNAQTLSVSVEYPTASHQNAKTTRISGSTVNCCDQSEPQTVNLSCGKDNFKWKSETAPTNVAVRFYIRAKCTIQEL
ncbi:hypothetical protein ACMFMG_001181 [Clarireedia jacksonii]